ncbi:MAG TPA: adenosylcobinamide amidohydrolase [Acidimicrobiia bacterium]|nr:adenosylcobinamide amidohydrolase [Acidimicrobiia bacterium]
MRALVWRFDEPRRCIASAPVGGGIGLRSWVLNAQVPRDYDRVDLDMHVAEVASRQGCTGSGVGMLTAASVDKAVTTREDGVEVCATVGLSLPAWAAEPAGASVRAPSSAWRPGTINVLARVDVRLSDAALVNAVMTVTEAKVQALLDAGVPGTGTATDAVCIVCPPHGDVEPFGGPRSRVGAPLARATHAAILQGIDR